VTIGHGLLPPNQSEINNGHGSPQRFTESVKRTMWRQKMW